MDGYVTKKSNTSLVDSSSTAGTALAGISPASTIAQVNGEVKENVRYSSRDQTEMEHFKRWFGDWQNTPECIPSFSAAFTGTLRLASGKILCRTLFPADTVSLQHPAVHTDRHSVPRV